MSQVKIDTQNLGPHGAYANVEDLLELRFASKDLNLFSRRPTQAVMAGNTSTKFRGRGMEFEEVRVYQPGDDIRSIDWRVTARTQIPHTKLYCEERERPVFVVADQRSPMFFGSRNAFKSVIAASLSASIGWAALQHSDRLGALIFGDNSHKDIRPRRSKHAVLQTIHTLVEFNQSLTSPQPANLTNSMKNLLEDTRRIARPGSAVFICSDFHDYDAECEKQLFQLARHTDVTLLHIYDELETHLPEQGMFTVTDGRHKLQLDMRNRQLKRQFIQQHQQRVESIQRTATAVGAGYIAVTTADDPVNLLQQVYGKRAVRPKHRH